VCQDALEKSTNNIALWGVQKIMNIDIRKVERLMHWKRAEVFNICIISIVFCEPIVTNIDVDRRIPSQSCAQFGDDWISNYCFMVDRNERFLPGQWRSSAACIVAQQRWRVIDSRSRNTWFYFSVWSFKHSFSQNFHDCVLPIPPWHTLWHTLQRDDYTLVKVL